MGVRAGACAAWTARMSFFNDLRRAAAKMRAISEYNKIMRQGEKMSGIKHPRAEMPTLVFEEHDAGACTQRSILEPGDFGYAAMYAGMQILFAHPGTRGQKGPPEPSPRKP